MDYRSYLATLTLSGLGLLGAVISMGLIISGGNPQTYLGGLWIWITVFGTLLAELIIYISWRRYAPLTVFLQQLQRISLFLIIYAIVLNISAGLLYFVVLAVTLFAWNSLYVEAGGMSLSRHDQALTLLIFVRLLIRPVLGLVFLLLDVVGITSGLELMFANTLIALVVGVLGRHAYEFGQYGNPQAL